MSFPTSHIRIAEPIAAALARGEPVVALETAVLTHGLPASTNIETALAMEAAVRDAGALPATIGVVEGEIIVGLSDEELHCLAASSGVVKASPRDLPVVMARRLSAGTTVAATAFLAHTAGIAVFVTGGIGGVHRQAGQSFDISADLPVLARTPITVVCAGAKSVLDLPATLEWLETAGVPVIGYGTDEFPGFFVRQTGLPLPARADTPDEVAALVGAQRALGLPQALLVAVPPPADAALAREHVQGLLEEALAELTRRGVQGKEVTPFLLSELARRSSGATLETNVALLLNNAAIGAAMARALAARTLAGR